MLLEKLGLNFLKPLLTRILRKQNQVILPIIIEETEKAKNILPLRLQTLNIVPLRAIHNEGVVGLRNVIKNPATNPFELGLETELSIS